MWEVLDISQTYRPRRPVTGIALVIFYVQSQSHFTADRQSVCWRRGHFVDAWPDIASFSRVWVCNLLSSVGRPLWREARSALCKSQSIHLSVCTFLFFTNLPYTLYNTCNIHDGPDSIRHWLVINDQKLPNWVWPTLYIRPLLVPARYSRLCPTTH
jgi:hypothetical protein